MKRFWIFVVGLFLLFDTVTAASQKSVLQFTKMVWNFGTIQEKDGPVSCRFDFVNTGKTPIVIEKVTVGCGCTTPKFSKEPVRPGAKGSITVTYNPKDRPGAFRKEITVRSTGGGEDVLSVTGDVVPSPKTTADRYPVSVGALSLSTTSVNLGYVARGKSKSRAIEYFNGTNRPVEVQLVCRTPRPSFTALPASVRIAAGDQGAVTLRYDFTASDVWGMQSDTVDLWIDGQLVDTYLVASSVATDDFSEMTADEIAAAPKAVFSAQYYNFGNLKAGNELRRSFTLKNEGKQPLIIRDMKLGPRMSTTLDPDREIAAGETVTFEVMMDTKDAGTGKMMDRIVLIVNDPTRPLRELRLAATIVD